MKTSIDLLKAAVRNHDPKLLKEALVGCEGMTDSQCYRVGLSQDPFLTREDWADLKKRAEEL